MSDAGKRLIEGAQEALAVARGEQPAAAVWVDGFKYVPAPSAGLDPVAWEATTPVYKHFVTDKQYRRFSEEVRRWYKPYQCSSCESAASESTLPDQRISSAIRKLRILKRDFAMKGANATTIERAIDLIRSIGRNAINRSET